MEANCNNFNGVTKIISAPMKVRPVITCMDSLKYLASSIMSSSKDVGGFVLFELLEGSSITLYNPII